MPFSGYTARPRVNRLCLVSVRVDEKSIPASPVTILRCGFEIDKKDPRYILRR
jgi:hypothetical protein